MLIPNMLYYTILSSHDTRHLTNLQYEQHTASQNFATFKYSGMKFSAEYLDSLSYNFPLYPTSKVVFCPQYIMRTV